MKLRLNLMALLLATCALPVSAQIMDGTLDQMFYGPALSIQNTNTQFGNADMADTIDAGGGSEINGFFARVDNGRLHVMMTGNLERNFNKFSLFFDTETGGHNQLDGSTLPGGVDGFCCGGLDQPNGALQRMNGLKFDTGFEADHFLTFSHGFETALSNPTTFWAMTAHYSDLTADASMERGNVAAGMQLAPQGMPNVLRDQFGGQTLADDPFLPDFFFSGPTVPANLGPGLPGLGQGELIDRNYVLSPGGGGAADDSGAGAIAEELKFALDIDPSDPTNMFSHRRMNNLIDLQMAIDNSNVAGVEGCGDTATCMTATTENPGDVLTGIEFSIPIDELGITGDFKIAGFVNSSGHDYASNQFIGDGILFSNLGSDGMGNGNGNLAGVDLGMITGDQFVTVEFMSTFLAGDYDGSGVVSAGDLNLVLNNWGADGTIPPDGWVNDFPSGTISAEELNGVLSHWGDSLTPAVPEPSGWALLCLGLVAFARRRS